MARALTAAAKAESQAAVVRPVVLVKLQFDSGAMRVWSGRGDLTFNSEVYSGVGDYGRIGAVEEGVEQRAFGIALSLSGIPAATVSLALGEDVQGRTAEVWLGFLDANYGLVADPMLAFRGRMDTMDVDLGATATVSVTAESRLADWNKPRVRLWTDASQRELYPNDKGFEFVSESVQKEIVWGGVVAGGQGGGPVAAGQGGGGGTSGNRGGSGEHVGLPGRPGGGN